MKKIIAGMLALTLALSAVGCGNVEEEEKSAGAENSAETSENAEESKPDEQEEPTESADSTSEESTSDSSETDEKPAEKTPLASGFVNKNNTIIEGYNDKEYDDQMLYLMMEKAVEQYNFIIDRDQQGYWDSINLKKVLSSKGLDILTENPNFEDDMEEAELYTYMLPVMILYTVIPDEIDELEDKYGDDDAELIKQFVALIREKADDLTFDDFKDSELFDEYSAYNSLFAEYDEDAYREPDIPDEFKASPESFKIVPDETAIFGIEVGEYISNERGTFAELDLVVALGDWEYVLDEVNAWVIDGEAGVIISDIGIEENEVKGMTFDEVCDMVVDIDSLRYANAAAKTAYNSVAEYFADQETQGISMQEVMKNDDFRNAVADETQGLNLELTAVPDTKGDKVLFNAMHDCDYNKGFVLMKPIDPDNYEFFVQYITPEGVIGQYPNPINRDDARKVIWGTYFAPENE